MPFCMATHCNMPASIAVSVYVYTAVHGVIYPRCKQDEQENTGTSCPPQHLHGHVSTASASKVRARHHSSLSSLRIASSLQSKSNRFDNSLYIYLQKLRAT